LTEYYPWRQSSAQRQLLGDRFHGRNAGAEADVYDILVQIWQVRPEAAVLEPAGRKAWTVVDCGETARARKTRSKELDRVRLADFFRVQ
jgi:hypothetical protein